MSIKFNLIAAACENMGIGKNNTLPWRLRSEMDYFTRMTKTTKDQSKKNVVIMGRRTWDSIPPKFKPLQDRINIVLSRSDVDTSNYQNVYAFRSLDEVIEKLSKSELLGQYERVWVIGGSQIYKDTMASKHFYRLYLTEIKKDFDCDTFMPALKGNLKEVSDADVPTGPQMEKDIEFVYKVYENPDYL